VAKRTPSYKADRRAEILGYSKKSEQWQWYCEAYEYNRKYDEDRKKRIVRDGYGAIRLVDSDARPRPLQELAAYRSALQIIKDNKTLEAYDNISFDRKGRADGALRTSSYMISRSTGNRGGLLSNHRGDQIWREKLYQNILCLCDVPMTAQCRLKKLTYSG
jgi:hypothetical protein